MSIDFVMGVMIKMYLKSSLQSNPSTEGVNAVALCECSEELADSRG